MNISAKNVQWASATESDARWAAVVARDPKADGTFYYSVETTGVYCRPSCAARLAQDRSMCASMPHTKKPSERASGRASVVKPNQVSPVAQHAANIAAACRYIEKSEEMPSLAQLARHAGLSPSSFPPGVQGGHGADAESLRGGAARQARAERTRHESRR